MFTEDHVKPELNETYLIKGYSGKVMHNGYVMVRKPSHPFAHKNGYIKEHRLVMEFELQRYLTPNEIVHHKNGVKTDNEVINLQLTDMAEHRAIHNVEDKTGTRQFDIDEVADLYSQGLSTRDVSEILGISKSTVQEYVQWLGISRTELQSNVIGGFNKGQRKYELEEVRSLYLNGMSIRDIAKKFDCAVNTIHRYVNELGVVRTQEQIAYENNLKKEVVINMHLDGYKPKVIINETGLGQTTVYRYIREYKNERG